MCSTVGYSVQFNITFRLVLRGLKSYSAIRVFHKLYAVNKNGNTGQERLIRSHSLARFCFELSVNSN